jgi:hypothetical protein
VVNLITGADNMAIVSKSVSQNHVISGKYHFEARGKKGLSSALAISTGLETLTKQVFYY